jgi:hypothetical protein
MIAQNQLLAYYNMTRLFSVKKNPVGAKNNQTRKKNKNTQERAWTSLNDNVMNEEKIFKIVVEDSKVR